MGKNNSGEQISGRKLHIHHKDKNHNNNSLDNLQVVCVRCHNLIIHKRDRDELGRFISKEAM
jgi:5-methylcytosine-specific restriction endonuclease McrA